MATRKEAKQFLFEQLEKLHKEEHVDDLMKDGRIEELVDIPEDLDCSVLRDFLNEHNKFFLEVEEIPDGCHYELAFWINQSCEPWFDNQIFDDYEEYIIFLYSLGENLADTIAATMESRDLSGLALAELLFGIEDD